MSHHVLKEAKSYLPTAGVKEFASHTCARSMVLPNYLFWFFVISGLFHLALSQVL
jgi:hypothetical protein